MSGPSALNSLLQESVGSREPRFRRSSAREMTEFWPSKAPCNSPDTRGGLPSLKAESARHTQAGPDVAG